MKGFFTRAIVRPPGVNFASGLTTVDLGVPNYAQALQQHQAYCEALGSCGLKITTLAPDPDYPDSTFVEDTAVLTERCAILTRPGAKTRRGEVAGIARVLIESFSPVHSIQEPGTLDAGDVCEAGNHFFIGVSARTNEAGAEQLAEILAAFDYTSSLVDLREVSSILHLKSGLAYLGANQLVIIEELANRQQFQGYHLLEVESGEEYAANCVLVNGAVLVAAGFQLFAELLQTKGFRTVPLAMSEFQKMDGGLSCLSLRF
jgi:dimethylargininase